MTRAATYSRADTAGLPQHWRRTTAAALFEFITSGSRGWAKYYSDSGALFLRVGNLDHDNIALDLRQTQRVTPPSGAEALRTRVRSGDLLVSITADVGMVGLVPDDLGEAYVNQHVAIARPVQGINSRWLAWAFTSPAVKSQLRALDRGATKMGLGLDDIRRVQLAVPPEGEQDRIVSEIEKHFTRLDAALAGLEQAQRKLELYRSSFLESCFWGDATGRAVATGVLPQGWRWHTLGDISESSDYGTSEKCGYDFDGPSVIRIPNIVDGRLDLADLKRAKAPGPSRPEPLAEGDFLIIRTNGSKNLLGRAALVSRTEARLLFASYLIRFRLKPDESLRQWLARIWDAPSIRKQIEANAASSAGQHNISTKPLERIRVPVPPEEARIKLVAEIDRHLTLAASLGAESQRSVRRTFSIRSGILANAFNGRLSSVAASSEGFTG